MIASAPLVGIVTALPAEARALKLTCMPPVGAVQQAEGALVARAGMGPERAGRAAGLLLEQGARALVSWGTAGGLDPALRPGNMLLPVRIIGSGHDAYSPDRHWRMALETCLQHHTTVRSGTLVCQSHAIASVADKARLGRETGAVACDMESAAVGAAAQRAGVPLLVARAVADSADSALNKLALQALDAGGELRLAALLGGLCRWPGELAGLLRLANCFRAACTTLAAVVRVAGLRLAYPHG
jgi:adenosylhomocysteine nucleosidase